MMKKAAVSDRDGGIFWGANWTVSTLPQAFPRAAEQCFSPSGSYSDVMEETLTQGFAIQARVASVIGLTGFDQVFAGVRFAETDGPLLRPYEKQRERRAD
jgi:hypothetical protein